MFDKFIEQSQVAFKPFNELVSLNTKVMEEATQKQKAFVNDIINDGLAFTKELSSQKDFSGVYQTQKSYLEGLQERFVTASTEAYELYASTQEKAGEVIKNSAAS